MLDIEDLKSQILQNLSFLIDILSFVLYNFNPINIERKVHTENEQKMISFIWEVCVPTSLTCYIFNPKNYQIISDPILTYQKANKIIKSWIADANIADVSNIISSNFKSIHFIYSSFFPKIYSRINPFGIKNKSKFDLAFALYKTNKTQSNFEVFLTGKNPNYYIKREEINENEQKPIVIQDENTEDKKLLKHKLDENTKQMELIKKVKRNYVKKPIVIN